MLNSVQKGIEMKRLLPFIALFALLLPGVAVAVEDAVKNVGKAALDVVFSEAEKRVMNRYYKERERLLGESADDDDQDADNEDTDEDSDDRGDRKSKKKKGKKHTKGAKQKEMPPGIRKKLERGGELPPGLAKQGLPADLEEELPPAPEGHERAVIDNKVVLIDTATGVIKDIFRPRQDGSGGTTQKRTRLEGGNGSTGTDADSKAPEPKNKWWEFWK